MKMPAHGEEEKNGWKSCVQVFCLVMFCCFAYLLFLTAFFPYSGPVWIGLVSLGIILFLYWKRKPLLDRWEKLARSADDALFWKIQGVSLALMFPLTFFLRVGLTWDYGYVICTAYDWAFAGKIDASGYYARYGNNQLIWWLLSQYFRLIRVAVPRASLSFCQAATIPVSCLLVELAIQMTYRTARLCMGQVRAFTAGVLCLLCSPIFLYSTFAYTDTFGLLPMILIFYFYLRFLKEAGRRRWLYLAGMSLIGAFGIRLKAFIGIALLAVALDYLVRLLRGRRHFFKNAGKFVAVLLVFVLLGNTVVAGVLDSFTGFRREDYEKNQFPAVHWVMMALGKTGGYNQDDVNFTAGFKTLKERERADWKVIGERLEERGFFGTAFHVFYVKWQRTWACPTCGVGDFLAREPRRPGVLQQLFTKNGKFFFLYSIYASVWWLLLLAGILQSLWRRRKDWDEMLLFHLTLFGLLLFLSIWECNSRYLVVFLPVFVLSGTDGLELSGDLSAPEKKEEK